MAVASPAELLAFLQEHEFLTPAQVRAVGYNTPVADGRSLVRLLVERNWLTPYQADKLLEGRGEDLLLGDYRVLELLGEGGMGQVFKARHAGSAHLVALKTIPRDRVSDPVARARFDREVRAVAGLLHPNIVTAFEAHQSGLTHFLVMEYVDGIDLARLVQQSGPLSVPSACEYVRQAAAGLQHAHERGLVHRDIKPGNLMVARPDPDGPPVVKILDFGLARLASESPHAVRLTQLGTVVGTVDYIAPEQARNARRADIRADIYSLGCSLFYLLTGHPPFAGEDTVQKISARALGEPPSVRESRPEVSPSLERVLLKMMARSPGERYQTPDEVAEALRPHTEDGRQAHGTAVFAPPSPAFAFVPAVEERPRKRRRKARGGGRQFILLAVTGVALALIPGLAIGVALLTIPRGPGNQGAPLAPKDGESRTQPGAGPALEGPGRGADAPAPTVPLAAHEVRRFQAPPGGCMAAAATPDGRFLLGCGCVDEIWVWQVSDGRRVYSGTGERYPWCMAVSPDGRYAAVGMTQGQVVLWDVKNRVIWKSLPAHKANPPLVLGVAFSPDGKRLASAGRDRSIRHWDVETGLEVGRRDWLILRDISQALAFTPDGRHYVAVGSPGECALVFSVNTNEEVARFTGHRRMVSCVAVAPDNLRAVSGGSDGDVRVWEWPTGKERLVLGKHSGGVESVAVSADGRWALSGGRDKAARLWELASGREARRYEGHEGPIRSVGFLNGSPFAFTAGRENSGERAVHLWRLPD